MTNRDELRAAYARLRDFIDRQAPTHTELRSTLADLETIGKALASLLEVQPTQAALLDVPAKKRGGY